MILVTGASGFVGAAVISRLVRDGRHVPVASARRTCESLLNGVARWHVADMATATDWSEALRGVSTVVHAAARVHITGGARANDLTEYRRVNVFGTMELAAQAARAGVRRFVFISSVKVNGEETFRGRPFGPSDSPAPVDAYGISKKEAERQLRGLAEDSGMEVVVIRPPLVYGPGVKANFRALMRCVQRRLPLPLGAIDNLRSFVGLDNLVDLIAVCVDHVGAANQTFFVSDGLDLSTPELLTRMGKALGTRARLVPVPLALLRAGGKLLRKEAAVQKLCASLQVDISCTRELLGWRPSVTVDAALEATAKDIWRETIT